MNNHITADSVETIFLSETKVKRRPTQQRRFLRNSRRIEKGLSARDKHFG
jgi:hypothetical protein